MPTPPKPVILLKNENKSHRTKKELKQREESEKALLTGYPLKERKEVKNNKIAHKEFKRLETLLKTMEKNDAIYEITINRYCLLVAECSDLEEKRDKCYSIIEKLDERFETEIDNAPIDERAKLIKSYAKAYNDLLKSLLACDSQVQTKRRMLLDIEKENIMTIAAALRNIPKKIGKEENPLFKALNGS